MKYGHFTQDGLPLGFYDDTIHAQMPDGVVPLTDDQWVELIENTGLRRWDGSEVVARAIELSAEQLVEQIRAMVQAHIDTTARAHLYDNGNSMASYVASTNAQWASEAQAFVAWRDAVWTHVYALWDNPPEPWPTADDVVASLPIFSLGE